MVLDADVKLCDFESSRLFAPGVHLNIYRSCAVYFKNEAEPPSRGIERYSVQKRRDVCAGDWRLDVNNIPQVNKSPQAFLPAESACACTENAGFSRLFPPVPVLICPTCWAFQPPHMSRALRLSPSPHMRHFQPLFPEYSHQFGRFSTMFWLLRTNDR